MVTQSSAMTVALRNPALGSGAQSAFPNWRAYHIFYHGDRALLLRDLVQPLLCDVIQDGLIDHFYFIRYALGGPHVRLRWRAKDESAAASADLRLATAIERFFSRCPSTVSVNEENIRNTNRSLLSVDTVANREDDRVYDDNSWHASPPLFEFDRYGGIENFQHSLDLFCVSSAATLELLREHGNASPGWERASIMRQWLRMAFGLAQNGDEFMECVDYGNDFFAGQLQRCAAEGEAVFSRNGDGVSAIASRELQQLSTCDGGKPLVAQCARILASRVAAVPEAPRRHIFQSHMHMAANRLGLTNPEEVYLSRMLTCAVRRYRTQGADQWRDLWRGHAAVDREIQGGELVHSALKLVATDDGSAR
jgi:lantibiotic biosynthesis dehydratase-like protein